MNKKSNQIIVSLLIILVAPLFTQAASIDDLKQDLENQIKQKQQEINQYQDSISQNQQKSKTLQTDIKILEDQINKVRLEINQIDLVIQKSTLNIQEIDSQINDLKDRVDQKKDLLSEYIRTMAYYDQETLLEVILKNEKFSDFFDELNSLENIQEQIQSILIVIHELKGELQEQKDEMEGQRSVQNRLKTVQLSQKRDVENKQWQKEDLLDKTKGEEFLYRQMIQNNQKEINYIKDQLTLLDRYNITLDDAVQNAIYAGTKTGIRPAYLLGVLENESRLGLNVGTGNWIDDMYQCNINRGYITMGSNLKNAFLQICEELGLNPDLQSVSAKPTAYTGCGGAMGIAQFMSTTWLSYKDRIAAITGNNPPNPWNFKDAFTASAIKLADAGATSKTYEAERKAYAIYVGGKYWQGLLSVAERAMVYAAQFQKEYFD
ncbi:lytic murein transglycosylase [Patescibacteria group bacterium]|nr:lytic murein transglycosylase [Patescibacteria group bacterium]MBU1563776.1 lytic murein transglycosylase [Patescibacteria group bacterium]MBU2068254.1 lytic murein transglycosylase [Patescibacteria group bacterium]